MQPNTSLRLRMCISPLMFRLDIISFSPWHTGSQNCKTGLTSFATFHGSDFSDTATHLPPPFSNPPTPGKYDRQDKEYQQVKEHLSVPSSLPIVPSRTSNYVQESHPQPYCRECYQGSSIRIRGAINGISQPAARFDQIPRRRNPFRQCPSPSRSTNSAYK